MAIRSILKILWLKNYKSGVCYFVFFWVAFLLFILNFLVSSGYILIKCDRISAALGTSCPASCTAIDIERCSGIWQSIQLLTIEAPIDLVILHKLSCPGLWQVTQRWENTLMFPLSFLWGLWQLPQVMVLLDIKHLLALSNPYWLPCTSTLPVFKEAVLTVSIIN